MKREKSARHRRTGKIGQKFRTGICSVKPMQRKKREMAIDSVNVPASAENSRSRRPSRSDRLLDSSKQSPTKQLQTRRRSPHDRAKDSSKNLSTKESRIHSPSSSDRLPGLSKQSPTKNSRIRSLSRSDRLIDSSNESSPAKLSRDGSRSPHDRANDSSNESSLGGESDDQKYEKIRKSLVSFEEKDGHVQLVKGYKIYINSNELTFLKDSYRNKPGELARRLMRLIIGKKELKKMRPTGRGDSTEIPDHIFKAVYAYTYKKCQVPEKKLLLRQFTRVMTNMCNGLRNKKKRNEKNLAETKKII
ncbi:hypothetical protein TKK_0013942 [Trichogramma kaykai]